MSRRDRRRRGSRRVHRCERCPFITRREAHASKLACPKCGGRVLLTSGRRETPKRRKVELSLPEDWIAKLGPRPCQSIRVAIARMIGVDYEPRGD